MPTERPFGSVSETPSDIIRGATEDIAAAPAAGRCFDWGLREEPVAEREAETL